MSEPVFSHIPVMLGPCIDALCIGDGSGTFVDGTAGGGGHSLAIVSRLTTGRLIAFDQDADAIAAASERLKDYKDKVTFVHANFSNLEPELGRLGITSIDGILLDLGVSSYQLDNPERGFSYMADAPLDMRMDRSQALTAYEVVNRYSEEDLKRILWTYGEERFAPRIAFNIIRARAEAPVTRTGQLVDIVMKSIPTKAREGGHHPAKKTFQAIRVEVNRELDVIEPTLRQAVRLMKPGGRLAVITFQPGEDLIVKQTMADLAKGCICPRDFPVCVCGRTPQIRFVSKKPLLPDEQELESNPRSRSAKQRVVEKL